MTNRNNPINPNQYVPQISSKVYREVSDYRKGKLQQEFKNGLVRDGSGSYENNVATAASYVASSVQPGAGLIKESQVSSLLNGGSAGGSSGGDWRGSHSGLKQLPEIYSPLWLNSNLNLPRDRATINAWCRSFFALQPFVQNAINLHSTYPISKLNIKCPNKKIENFFNDMNEDIELQNRCVEIAQEYWLLGEAFPYAELDQNTAKWSRIILQNPDYIVIKRSVVASDPIIMMRPDDNLRRIVFSNKPGDIQQRKQLNPTIIQHVKRGENIPLDSFYISHLARKLSSYEVRGSGLPVSCFRQLALFDLLRENKFVQSSELINPITLVQIGNESYRPTPEDIEIYRQIFEQGASDKNFKIFCPDGVKVERIGASSGILDINPDIQQLLKEIMIALMVPEVVLTSSGDISYANGGVALDVLRQRYLSFRNMMAAFLRKKIFAPISKLNDFYEYKDGEKKLIIPSIEWNHLNLFDSADHINVLMQLSGEDRRVSKQTLYRSLGLEWEDEQRKIKQEDIRDAVRKKEMMSLDRMPLNELRSLNEDDEIPEITESALPTDSPYADQMGPGGLPGLEPSGGGMSGGLPGLGGSPSGGGLDLGGAGLGLGGPTLPPPPPSSTGTPGVSVPPIPNK